MLLCPFPPSPQNSSTKGYYNRKKGRPSLSTNAQPVSSHSLINTPSIQNPLHKENRDSTHEEGSHPHCSLISEVETSETSAKQKSLPAELPFALISSQDFLCKPKNHPIIITISSLKANPRTTEKKGGKDNKNKHSSQPIYTLSPLSFSC